MKLMKFSLFFILLLAFSNISCSVYQTMVNISRLKFKLDNVSNLSIAGVQFANKRSIQDFNALEALKLSSAFASGNLPATFIINIAAVNPNDGSGGYPKTNATLKEFPWRLLLDDKETVSGGISNPVTVPGTGENTVIPLAVTVDLYKFFKDKGYESLLNLALNIGGQGGNPSNVALYAKPTVSSPLGDITYPQEIKIVNYQYTK